MYLPGKAPSAPSVRRGQHVNTVRHDRLHEQTECLDKQTTNKKRLTQQTGLGLELCLSVSRRASSFPSHLIPPPLARMAPPKQSTAEQLEFLENEDLKWEAIKLGATTLKSFYVRTAKTFLEKWPTTPDQETLKAAAGDVVKAQAMAEEQVHKVSSRALSTLTHSHPNPVAHS